MFVDSVKVEFQAGRGGDGCMSFRREKYVPQGGPDGGDGGDGASIILRAREGVNSLADFVGRTLIRAPKGTPGMGSGRHGRNGKEMVLYVPPGTTVIDAEHHFVIRDLVKDGDEFVLARGGKGGHGNMHFKTSTNRAPRERTLGSEGESRTVILELKSIADVGLVGKPNAGKSTLLSRLTRARPEIADYPFTTKYPNLGQVFISNDRSFVLADIPGLIEGASEGVGLGHEFLKHVQRAGILVHLVEPAPIDGSDPIENYHAIRVELEAYSRELAERPEIIAVTKGELPAAEAVLDALKSSLAAAGQTEKGQLIFAISAVTGQGLDALLQRVWELLTKVREEQKQGATDSFPLEQAAVASIEVPVVHRQKEAKKRRTPPHLSGPTAQLSDENPPSRYQDPGEGDSER